MMAGYLLARAGIDVVVLEKHADFNRDFRGDTIHPSTLDLMSELGLLDEFLKLPHQEVAQLSGIFNGRLAPLADFSRLPTHCKFIAFMPQWDFLDFFSAKAKGFPSFALRMQHEVVDLIFDQERVAGVQVMTPEANVISAPISSLAQTGVMPLRISAPGLRFVNWVCLSTSFGCISPNTKAIPSNYSDSFATANCSS